MTLVVLPDTDLRERLSRELIVCGLDAVAAPDWFAAAEIARARPVAAVVFDSGHAVMNGVGWRDGVARLRAAGATPVVVWLRAMGPAPEAASSNQPTHPPTHPPTNQPTNSEPPSGRGRRAPMTAYGFQDPIVVPVRDDDLVRLASDVARVIVGTSRRRDFNARFDELHARHQAGDESAGGEIWTMTRRALFRRLHGWALALGHAESGEAIEDSVTDAVIKALELGRYDRRRSPDPMAWLAHDRAKPAQGLWSAEPCAAATRPGRPGRRVGRRPARVRGGIGGIRGPGRARGGGARTGAVAERDHDDAGGSCGC